MRMKKKNVQQAYISERAPITLPISFIRGEKEHTHLGEERSSRKGALHHITSVTTTPSLLNNHPSTSRGPHGGLRL